MKPVSVCRLVEERVLTASPIKKASTSHGPDAWAWNVYLTSPYKYLFSLQGSREDVSSFMDNYSTNGVKLMRVGIISEKNHAKSLRTALMAEGLKPILLGPNPSTVPVKVDVLVCRVKSCSHGAADVAQAIRRKGDIPVIFEDGVLRALQGVKEALGLPDKAPDVDSAAGELEDLLVEAKQVESVESVKPVEVKAPVPARAPIDPVREVQDLMALLQTALQEAHLGEFVAHGLSVEVLTVHLAAPEGTACGGRGKAAPGMNLAAVTCQACRATGFYKQAAWILGNLQA